LFARRKKTRTQKWKYLQGRPAPKKPKEDWKRRDHNRVKEPFLELGGMASPRGNMGGGGPGGGRRVVTDGSHRKTRPVYKKTITNDTSPGPWVEEQEKSQKRSQVGGGTLALQSAHRSRGRVIGTRVSGNKAGALIKGVKITASCEHCFCVFLDTTEVMKIRPNWVKGEKKYGGGQFASPLNPQGNWKKLFKENDQPERK